MNKDFFLILKSTFVTFLISCIVALATWLLGVNYIAAFLLSMCFQYVLFSFLGSIINNFYAQKTRQKELDKLEQLSSILQCASCKEPNVITFIPDENERLEFVCTKCSKKNVVNINFTVAGVTDPIVLNPTVPNPEVVSVASTNKE